MLSPTISLCCLTIMGGFFPPCLSDLLLNKPSSPPQHQLILLDVLGGSTQVHIFHPLALPHCNQCSDSFGFSPLEYVWPIFFLVNPLSTQVKAVLILSLSIERFSHSQSSLRKIPINACRPRKAVNLLCKISTEKNPENNRSSFLNPTCRFCPLWVQRWHILDQPGWGRAPPAEDQMCFRLWSSFFPEVPLAGGPTVLPGLRPSCGQCQGH